jgi:hypothetical protein
MGRSLRFRELSRRLYELRRNMLPQSFSATGDYSQRQLDRARGFRVLVHAEIEAFLEDIGLDKARTVVDNWKASKSTTDSLFCLVAHYHVGFEVSDENDMEEKFVVSSRRKVRDEIAEIADRALTQYGSIVSGNNGIKEENLLRLVLPVGVRRSDLDPTWITDLQEFGKRRGTIAHKSISAHQPIDPQKEWRDVLKLLVGLEALDALIAQAA